MAVERSPLKEWMSQIFTPMYKFQLSYFSFIFPHNTIHESHYFHYFLFFSPLDMISTKKVNIQHLPVNLVLTVSYINLTKTVRSMFFDQYFVCLAFFILFKL